MIVRNDFAGLPGFTLSKFTPSDIDSFMELGLPTCAFMHGRDTVAPSDLKRHFFSFLKDFLFDENSFVFIVKSPEGRYLAQIWLHSTHNHFNGLMEMWIWDLTVHPDFRGRGIGRNLLRFSKEFAEEKNCSELWLLVSSKNDEARQLYASENLHTAGHLMMYSCGQLSSKPLEQVVAGRFVLRPLCRDDVSTLHCLWTESGLPFKPKGRDQMARLSRHLSSSSIHGWGAFQNGKLVAGALASSDGRKGYIERLATLPQYRKAGLAKAVVTACMQTLKEAGIQVIAALIESENTASRELFESCGFVYDPGLCYYSIRGSAGD